MSSRQQLRFFPLFVFAVALIMGIDIGFTTVERPSFSKRAPSSQEAKLEQYQYSQIDIGCGGHTKMFKTAVEQIRLKGCVGGVGAPVKIVNLSTGLELTILENDELFTTDYFRLQKEENRLQVSYSNHTNLVFSIFYSEKSNP